MRELDALTDAWHWTTVGMGPVFIDVFAKSEQH
jgi:hypothetical protein